MRNPAITVITAVTLSLIVIVPLPVRAATRVPFSFFQAPVNAADRPQHYFLDGSNCQLACPAEYYVAPRKGQPLVYFYEVRPNVPSKGDVEAYYEVYIYGTVDAARKANLHLRKITPARRVSIAQPASDNEWLLGQSLPNDPGHQCGTTGGVQYQNIAVDAFIDNPQAVRDRSTYTCSAQYHWVMRVLKATYSRAIAYTKRS